MGCVPRRTFKGSSRVKETRAAYHDDDISLSILSPHTWQGLGTMHEANRSAQVSVHTEQGGRSRLPTPTRSPQPPAPVLPVMAWCTVLSSPRVAYPKTWCGQQAAPPGPAEPFRAQLVRGRTCAGAGEGHGEASRVGNTGDRRLRRASGQATALIAGKQPVLAYARGCHRPRPAPANGITLAWSQGPVGGSITGSS